MSFPTADEVTAALKSLGETSEQVALSLIQQGIKGRPGECATCPIAVFLERAFPGTWFLVGREFTTWTKEDSERAGQGHLPWPVANFIRRFDDGNLEPEQLEQLTAA